MLFSTVIIIGSTNIMSHIPCSFMNVNAYISKITFVYKEIFVGTEVVLVLSHTEVAVFNH